MHWMYFPAEHGQRRCAGVGYYISHEQVDFTVFTQYLDDSDPKESRLEDEAVAADAEALKLGVLMRREAQLLLSILVLATDSASATSSEHL